jgi:hypothetical protein
MSSQERNNRLLDWVQLSKIGGIVKFLQHLSMNMKGYGDLNGIKINFGGGHFFQK